MQAEMTVQDDDYDDDYDDDLDPADEGGLSGFTVLVMGVLVLAVFGFFTWFAYQQGERHGREGTGGVPYVAAEPGPPKVENNAPDPLETANREVYDRIAQAKNTPTEVIEPAGGEGAPADTNSGASDPIADIAANAVSDETSAPEPAAAAPAPSKAPEIKPEPVAQKPEPKPQPVQTKPVQTTPAPAAAASGALSGSHVVQIGAFRSEAEANAQWDKYRAKFPDLAAKTSKDIERADLGAKGIYYRLRVGPFSSKDAASEQCKLMSAAGMGCFVKSVS